LLNYGRGMGGIHPHPKKFSNFVNLENWLVPGFQGHSVV
jgi:hypothetical protein